MRVLRFLVALAALGAACAAHAGSGVRLWVYTGHHLYAVQDDAACGWDTEPYAADCAHYAMDVTPSDYRFVHTDTISTSVYFADTDTEIYFSDCIVLPSGGNPFVEYCRRCSDEIFADIETPVSARP